MKSQNCRGRCALLLLLHTLGFLIKPSHAASILMYTTLPPPPAAGSVGAQLPGSAGRAGATAAPPRGRRAPAPDLDPVGSRREVLATPTPRGPKFPESGDLAPELLPGPARSALRPPTPTPRPAARPGRPRSLLISADRGNPSVWICLTP